MSTRQKPATKSSAPKPAAKTAVKAAAKKSANPEAAELDKKKPVTAAVAKKATAAAGKSAPAKKPGRPTKGAVAAEKSAPPKRGRPGKGAAREVDEEDLSDIEADLEGEPEVDVAVDQGAVEKPKPLRISKVVNGRRPGGRDIDDAGIGQRVLQAQARPALLRSLDIAAFALAAARILHGMALVEDDDTVEIAP